MQTNNRAIYVWFIDYITAMFITVIMFISYYSIALEFECIEYRLEAN
jgi:hypothetical protein